MASIISFLDAINTGIGYIAAALFLLSLAILVVWYSISRINSYTKKGEDAGKGIFLGVIALVEALIFGYVIVFFPAVLEGAVQHRLDWHIKAEVFRWIFLFLTLPPLLYLLTRKYSGYRGLYTAGVILIIGLLGWLFERWLGVILISVPIYAILLHLINQLAQVVIPASNPGDKRERFPKFKVLLFYILGLQFPVWIAKDSAGRDFDTRIRGDYFNDFASPGLVWTHSHQVAGISAGVEFDQVEGPGTIFTDTYKRPIALVDLRTQIRTAEVDATTRDGITFKAILFTAFAIDFEDWPKKGWDHANSMRMTEDIKNNPALAKGIKINRRNGHYWYSTARVKSVLSTAGVDINPKDDVAGPVVYWDELAVKQVENAARQILSQRTVDELWRPVENGAGSSALDEIAKQIREIVEPNLRRIGITLYACRVVNFDIPLDSPVRKQQVDSWKTIWDQRITAALSEAAAIRKEEIEKAHAYAKSEVLDAIADSIEKARAEHPDLPRHVIALYYIHAIEEIVQKQPEAGSQEAKDRLEMIKQILLYNQ
jgi:hypothetical protein